MHLRRRTVRGSLAVLMAALVVVDHPASALPPAHTRPRAATSGPTVIHATCPSVRGLGSAVHPRAALRTARAFLRAERRRDAADALWVASDRWLRYRMASGEAEQLRAAFPRIPQGSERLRFRVRQPRWLDARFGRIGPYLNVRLKLLAAGVQVYSCPRPVTRRLVRAMWWVQVLLPDCACDPDRILDVLVVERHGRYGVFGID